MHVKTPVTDATLMEEQITEEFRKLSRLFLDLQEQAPAIRNVAELCVNALRAAGNCFSAATEAPPPMRSTSPPN